MNKIMLVTGTMVGYAYAMEFFIAWYRGNEYERFVFINRAFGPYWWAYWTMITCNVITPQLFWFKKLRTSIPVMFVVSIFVNIGMWFERFVIIVTSLHRDFLPSSWGYFHPTHRRHRLRSSARSACSSRCSCCSSAGSRMIAMAEVKGVLPERPAAATTRHAHDEHARARRAARWRRRRPEHGDADAARQAPGAATSPSSTRADAILHAAEKVRDAGYEKWDVHTPYPGPRHGRGDGPAATRGSAGSCCSCGLTGLRLRGA